MCLGLFLISIKQVLILFSFSPSIFFPSCQLPLPCSFSSFFTHLQTKRTQRFPFPLSHLPLKETQHLFPFFSSLFPENQQHNPQIHPPIKRIQIPYNYLSLPFLPHNSTTLPANPSSNQRTQITQQPFFCSLQTTSNRVHHQPNNPPPPSPLEPIAVSKLCRCPFCSPPAKEKHNNIKKRLIWVSNFRSRPAIKKYTR